MTIAKQLLLTELDYTAWADQLLLSACSALTDAELHRNLGVSHRSVIRTLRHIYEGERAWVNNLVANSIPSVADIEAAGAADAAQPDPAFDDLKQSWPRVWADARQWIEPLDEEELARELPCRLRSGADVRIPRWKVVLHFVNHSTLHRGQIISMLRVLGKPPSNADLFTYYQVEASRVR